MTAPAAMKAPVVGDFETVVGRIGVATFSRDFAHRYLVRYGVGSQLVNETGRTIVWCMLNPSTATHDQLDPTLRRCVDFSAREATARGWPGCVMAVVNIYALRSTDPAGLWRAADPIGPGNDAAIAAACKAADLVICGWGAHGERNGRGVEVAAQLHADGVELHHLGLTKAGEPKHPLYLAGATPLTRWA